FLRCSTVIASADQRIRPISLRFCNEMKCIPPVSLATNSDSAEQDSLLFARTSLAKTSALF
ncbi:MAG: hypothetical protein AB8B91_14680, partial [Rubripirellula sp.]